MFIFAVRCTNQDLAALALREVSRINDTSVNLYFKNAHSVACCHR